MQGLDFLFSPNSQAYEARQRMQMDDLKNTQIGLANQTAEAGLPGVVGLSQSRAAQGQIDQAGIADKIKVQQMEALQKLDAGQLKEMEDFGGKVGQIGAYLESIPPLLRGQEYQRMAQQYRLPQIPGLDQIQPEQLPGALTKMGQHMTLMSSDHLKKQKLKEMDEAGALERQKVATQGTIDAAGVRADASMQNAVTAAEAKIKAAEITAQKALELADKKSKVALGTMKPDVRWTYLNALAEEERTPTEQAEFVRLTKDRYNMKTLGNPALSSEIVAGQKPQTPIQRAGAAAEEIAQPAVPKSLPITGIDPKTVKDSFGSYEPEKYEYKIVNGEVYRKPKK